jgi:hypothetical protein
VADGFKERLEVRDAVVIVSGLTGDEFEVELEFISEVIELLVSLIGGDAGVLAGVEDVTAADDDILLLTIIV